jgi:hypothetical protein
MVEKLVNDNYPSIARCATVFATELRLLPQMECYRKLEAINDRYKQRSEERTD